MYQTRLDHTYVFLGTHRESPNTAHTTPGRIKTGWGRITGGEKVIGFAGVQSCLPFGRSVLFVPRLFCRGLLPRRTIFRSHDVTHTLHLRRCGASWLSLAWRPAACWPPLGLLDTRTETRPAAHHLEKENLPMISCAAATVGDRLLAVALSLLSTEAGGFQVNHRLGRLRCYGGGLAFRVGELHHQGICWEEKRL